MKRGDSWFWWDARTGMPIRFNPAATPTQDRLRENERMLVNAQNAIDELHASVRGPYFEVNNHAAPREPLTLAMVEESIEKVRKVLKDPYTPGELCFRREYLGSFEEGDGQRDEFTWNMSKPSPSYGLPVIFHEEKDLAPIVKVKYKEHPKGSAKWRRNKRRAHGGR